MGKQVFNIKGMLRDLSPSKTPNDYAYEIRNLRLTAQEDSTMLSLTSEKGNSQYTITGDSISGVIVGYCTLNNYLVLFTYDSQKVINYIYRLNVTNTAMTLNSVMLYQGELGITANTKIEATGIYENENIQKVYWIDGIHQPRFLNIVASASEMSSWLPNGASFDFVPVISMDETVKVRKSTYSGLFNAGTIQYVLTYYNRNGQQTSAFYQSPINYIAPNSRGASPEDTVDNSFSIRVYNPNSAFDYVRVYSIFRSSENGTPICKKVCDLRTTETSSESNTYTKFTGVVLGNATDVNYYGPLSTGAFDIYVVDSNNREVDIEDFLLYREGRTSYYSIGSSYGIITVQNSNSDIVKIQAASGETMSVWKYDGLIGINRGGTSALKKWSSITANIVEDTKSRSYLEFIDNGLSGEVVSYSEILYAGGTNIIPATMAQKNQTLFFGNYTSAANISEENKDIIKNNSSVHFGYSLTDVDKGNTGSYYMYHNQLDGDAKKITTFKGGETYHFGVILQDEHGAWTDVIPVGPTEGVINSYYPKDKGLSMESFYPVKAYINFNDTALQVVNQYKAVKVVRLDSLPSVVCQGALCPTVFNHKRENNAPYCMSSWFFRSLGVAKADTAHHTQNLHNGNIRGGLGASVEGTPAPLYNISEIQGAWPNNIGYYDTGVLSTLADTDMFVDWNTLTLHSPDIEFGSKLDLNYKMRIVGILPITSSRTSMLLSWSTPPISSMASHLEYTPITHNTPSVYGYELDLDVFAYKDGYSGANDTVGTYLYPVYPWHRNGSLTGEVAPTGTDEWHALLDVKVMASLRESGSTRYIMGPTYSNITKVSVYQEDEAPMLLEEDPDNWLFDGAKVYMGSMDTILVPRSNGYNTYGKSTASGSSLEVMHSLVKDAVRMKYKSSKHGVFSIKSSNNLIYVLPNVGIGGQGSIAHIGALAQIAPKAVIRAKLTPTTIQSSFGILTLTGNITPEQFVQGDVIMLTNTGYTTYLYYVSSVNSNSLVVKSLDENWINNHPEGDKINYQSDSGSNDDGESWTTITYKAYFIYHDSNGTRYYSVPITQSDGVELDPYSNELVPFHDFAVEAYTVEGVIPDDQSAQITQETFDVSSVNSDGYAYIYLAELYTDDLSSDYENTPWYVASEPVKTGKRCVEASIGDTYFQRYDCLKTYPFALEDQNQVIEIFSFMCESKINIDGRYDNRRGMADNTSVTNTNFNLLNMAYTQDDNFLTYHYLNPDDFNISSFPNQIIWTQTKVYGSDIDAWTQILPTSILDLDGSLGQIRALRLWNDNLICFQDSGISKIMYNERTTMSTEQGIPVEIANSGKVDGAQYISNQIGCSNKSSIQITQDGIYFIDSNTREIYRWAKGLESLSKGKGFNTYLYNNSIELDTEKTFYDPALKDIYFRFVNSSTVECLVYNEQVNEFTSFFDYDMDFLFPFKSNLISVEHNSSNLWKQFASSEYLRYFGETTTSSGQIIPAYKNYKIQLVSAENPTEDKVFTGVEFRADVLNGSITQSTQSTIQGNYSTINKFPFKTIKAWNEYQDTGTVSFERVLRRSTNLSQKFRIWRGDIGRDMNDKSHPLNRIRSPWARVELIGGGDDMKTVIHDIAVTYV